MFENFDELMDETMEELQENETMEQDDALENGEAEITPEEAESVGRGEYSPEARANAWKDYNRLSEKDRETFLRGHSRNAHIMNAELHRERTGSTTGEGEAEEASEEKEAAGYSSDYYEHRMASALKNGNKIAYDNARSNWAKAKVRESVGSTTGEGEAEEASEEEAAAGYSSDYYEHQMASALEKGNKIAYDNAHSNWAKAKAREAVGSTTGAGEVDETSEEKEAAGYSSDYYEHQMASALKNGNKIAYNNARSNWAKAMVRESVGEGEEKGSVGSTTG